MLKRRLALALLVFLVAAGASAIGLVATGTVGITSSARPQDHFPDSTEPPVAAGDADGDGVDDQSDILCSALSYVGTRPRYRSAYYADGYPDDGCGVCTDVIAFALRGAGYDLQKLVADDIAAHPEAYGIEEPDPAIDFRRVRNLRVYFQRTAQELTCDVRDVDAWQPGDIAVFRDHIGIVSDRRDADGVPYLIHHEGPFQLRYENDALATRSDLTDHFRLRASS